MGDFSHVFDYDPTLESASQTTGHTLEPQQTPRDLVLDGLSTSLDETNVFDKLLSELDATNDINHIYNNTAQVNQPNNSMMMKGMQLPINSMYYIPPLPQPMIYPMYPTGYPVVPLPMPVAFPPSMQMPMPMPAFLPVEAPPSSDNSSVSSGEYVERNIYRQLPPAPPGQQFLTPAQFNRRVEYEIRHDEQEARATDGTIGGLTSSGSSRSSNKRKNKNPEVFPSYMPPPQYEGQNNARDSLTDPTSPLTLTSPSTNSMGSTGSYYIKQEVVNKPQSPCKKLIQFPFFFFEAFNSGDLDKVREMVDTWCTIDCALKTTALTEDIYGRNYVYDLYQALFDAHPDAMFVAKKCQYVPEEQAVKCNVYFAGTRITSTVANPHIIPGQEAPSNHPFIIKNEHLFHPPNTTLLTQMDTSMLKEPDIASMLELERSSNNLTVFAKGGFILDLTDDLKTIKRFEFFYTISSFRDAEVA